MRVLNLILCKVYYDINTSLHRATYSLHKKSHLVKPFVICASNGRIFDIFGPFKANENDASILKSILTTNQELSSLIKKNDVFVLDRGFRDCIELLENEFQLKTMMPELLDKSKKQFSNLQANKSRLCTKIRWVVEATNSLLKQCIHPTNAIESMLALRIQKIYQRILDYQTLKVLGFLHY